MGSGGDDPVYGRSGPIEAQRGCPRHEPDHNRRVPRHLPVQLRLSADHAPPGTRLVRQRFPHHHHVPKPVHRLDHAPPAQRQQRDEPGHGPVGLTRREQRHHDIKNQNRRGAADEKGASGPRPRLGSAPRDRRSGRIQRQEQGPAEHRHLRPDQNHRPHRIPSPPPVAGGDVPAGHRDVPEQVSHGGPIVLRVPDDDGCDAGQRHGCRRKRPSLPARVQVQSASAHERVQEQPRDQQHDRVLEQESDGKGCAQHHPRPARPSFEGTPRGPGGDGPGGDVRPVDRHQHRRDLEDRRQQRAHRGEEARTTISRRLHRQARDRQRHHHRRHHRGQSNSELRVAKHHRRRTDRQRDPGPLAVVRPVQASAPLPVVRLVLDQRVRVHPCHVRQPQRRHADHQQPDRRPRPRPPRVAHRHVGNVARSRPSVRDHSAHGRTHGHSAAPQQHERPERIPREHHHPSP